MNGNQSRGAQVTARFMALLQVRASREPTCESRRLEEFGEQALV